MITSVRRRRLMVPMTMFVGGGAITASSAIGGASAGPVAGLAAMTVFATLGYLVIGFGKTDFGALVGGSPDERQAILNVRAAALAGGIMTVVLLIGTVVELALGHSGQPWISLAAGAGVAYFAAFLVLRHR